MLNWVILILIILVVDDLILAVPKTRTGTKNVLVGPSPGFRDNL